MAERNDREAGPKVLIRLIQQKRYVQQLQLRIASHALLKRVHQSQRFGIGLRSIGPGHVQQSKPRIAPGLFSCSLLIDSATSGSLTHILTLFPDLAST